MNNKPLSWVLIVLLAILAGCSDGSGGGQSDDDPAGSTPPPTDQVTTIDGPDGSKVVVPAGAMPQGTTIRIARDATDMPALPAGLRPVGDVYVVTPHDQSFSAPVTVQLPLPGQPLSAGEELQVAKLSPGGAWELLTPEMVGTSLVVSVGTFSWFVAVAVDTSGASSGPAFQAQLASMSCGYEPCDDVWGDGVQVTLNLTTNGAALPSACYNPRVAVRVTPASASDVPISQAFEALEQEYRRTQTSYRFAFALNAVYVTNAAGPDGISGTQTRYASVRNVELVLRCGERQVTETVLAAGDVTFPAKALGDTIRWPGPFAAGISMLYCNGGPCTELVGPQRVTLVASVPRDVQINLTYCLEPRLVAARDRDLTTVAYAPYLGLYAIYRFGSYAGGLTMAARYSFYGGLQVGTPWMVEEPSPARSERMHLLLQCSNRWLGRVGFIDLPFVTPEAPAITTQPRSVSLLDGDSASFFAVVTGVPTPTLQWQRRAASTDPWTDIAGANAASYTTAPLTMAENSTEYRLVATNVSGDVASVPVTATVTGFAIPPSIAVQPTPLTVVAGSEAVFAVVARGTEALSYQWYRGSDPITAANGAVIKTGPVTPADTGTYYVVVSNRAGEITSARVRLTVVTDALPTTAPTIVTQPAGLTVNEGNSATFAVGVSGTGPFTYQWRKDGAFITGANAASLTIPSVATADAGNYSVVVTNAVGEVASSPATLTVIKNGSVTAPTITTHPATIVVPAGASATLAVAVSGTSPFTYQWSRNGVRLAGATGPVLTLTNITSLEGGSYTVSVTNAAGSVTSDAAEVIVLGVPVITTQPAATSVTDGGSATFSVVASGDSLRYQWQRDGEGIPGAESATYATPAVTLGDDGSVFSVIVYNAAGLVVSSAARLTVTAAPPTITRSPAAIAVDEGATATFSVVAGGTAPLSYQWRRDGADIPGATGAVYATPPVTSDDDGARFSVVVSNEAGTAVSGEATLTVNAGQPAAWGPTELLEGAPELATHVSAAISRETGDGVVVWTQSPDGLNEGVYANRYDFATDSWSGRVLLGAGTDTRETVYYPAAAMNAAGDIVVAWMQNTNKSTGNVGTIRASRYTPGVGWSEAYQLTRLPGGPEPAITWTLDVDVDMDAAGNAIVLWVEQYNYPWFELVSAARMPASGSFETAALLESSQDAFRSEEVSIVLDDAGNATAAWKRNKPSSPGVQVVTRRRAAGADDWDAEVVLADTTSDGRLRNLSMAVEPSSGDVLLAWTARGPSGTPYDLRYARHLATSSGWTPPATGESDTRDVGWTSVAVARGGSAAIAWERVNTDSTIDVRATRVDLATGALSAEIAVANGADLPSIGIDPAGNIMAVYSQSDGFRPRITALRLPASGAFESSVLLSSPSIHSDFGSVVVADDGTVLASWMQGNLQGGLYTSGDVYGKLYR